MRYNKYIAIAAGLVLAVASCTDQGKHSETPGTKHEWSILQGVEYQNRGSVPSTPEFKTVEGYELLSVPDLTNSKRIWIMLWPKNVPYYKQMPDDNYSIESELVDVMVKEHRVSSAVEAVLKSHHYRKAVRSRENERTPNQAL